MKPWEPQKGESIPAFQAFAEYRDMGEVRSLRAVAQKLDKSLTVIGRWSTRWRWLERVKDYEAYMDGIEQKAREKALTKKAEDWAAKELEMASLLYDKAKAMLAFPLAQQRTQDGKTIVEPARWGMRDASAIADTAVKLARLSQGEATSITKDVSDISNEDRANRILELIKPGKAA